MPELSYEQLKEEIEKIGGFIAQAKREIAAIGVATGPEDQDKRLANASLELEQVVRDTEQATNTIMDRAEALMALSASITDPEIAAQVNDHALGALEACSFQDITGQRIRKVMRTLEQVEMRIHNLIRLFGGHLPDADEAGDLGLGPQRPDEHLLNGPQLGDQAPSQEDIDRLFSQS